MQPTAAVDYRASSTRQLSGSAAAARAAVLRALVIAGFRIDSDLLTGIRAQRGSAMAAALHKPDKLPVRIDARFEDGGNGCTVRVDIADRRPGTVSRSDAIAKSYRAAFETVLAAVDSALQVLDPVAATRFPPIECTIAEGIGTPNGPGRVGALMDRTNEMLGSTPGSPRRDRTPSGSVMLVLPAAFAVLQWQELQGMATAGTMIATRPGAMPEKLVREVSRVVAALEAASPQAGPVSGIARIDLDAAVRPVLEFLRLQARLRVKLPLRTLQVCTTCRLEKVINPDFQRLQARNRKLRILSGTIGGAISMHGVSAFLLIGRLAQLKLLDPDFVCPRCQGMTAESTLITFCPRCGDRRAEAALRTCPACKYDLRAEVPAESMWTDGAPQPEVPESLPTPVTGPAAWDAPVAPWPAPVAAGSERPFGSTDPDLTVKLAGLPPPPDALSAGPSPGPAPGAAALDARDAARWYPASVWPAPVMPAPSAAAAAGGQAPAGAWHPDPHRRHEYRWWDGAQWTAYVADRGVAAIEA